MKRENNAGIDISEFDTPDYGEMITISNGLINGLRIEIINDDLDGVACFQIEDAATAMQIAQALTEYSQRIGNPSRVTE